MSVQHRLELTIIEESKRHTICPWLCTPSPWCSATIIQSARRLTVKRFVSVYLAMAASLSLVFCDLAQASIDSSGATGTQYETTGITGYQALEGNTATTPAPMGSTYASGKQIPGSNSGALSPNLAYPTTGTEGLAVNSVNNSTLPSGSYTFGFPTSSASN